MSKAAQTGVIQLNESATYAQPSISLYEILDILYDPGRDSLGLQQVREGVIGDPGRPSRQIRIASQGEQ